MNRKNFYFGQKVKADSELDAAFDDVEAAISAFLASFGYTGICNGAEVTEHTPNNLTVDVEGSAIVYDQQQRRIAWGPTQNVSIALDELGSPTAVLSGGNEKYLSIFAEYRVLQSDPRVDKAGNPLFFVETESFRLNVAQGAEAPIGTATLPPLRGDQILLADIHLVNGQTTITNGDIDESRAQLAYVLTGSPNEIREKGLHAVLQDMLDILNAFGAGTIASPGISDSPISLASGTILSQLTDLLAALNDDAALLGRSNTFDDTQVVDNEDATHGLLSTTKTASDDSHGGNLHKLILGPFPCEGVNARVYTFFGGLAFTLNAAWNPATLKWAADNVLAEAVRLDLLVTLTGISGLQMRFKPAGTVIPWNDTNWNTNSSTGAQAALAIGGEFVYTFAKSRRLKINCDAHAPNDPTQWTISTIGTPKATADGAITAIPIRLPNGAVLQILKVMHAQTTSTPASFTLARRNLDFVTPAVTQDTLAGPVAGPGSSGLKVTTVLSSPVSIATEIADYYLIYTAAKSSDAIHSIEVFFDDPGPNNQHG